MRVPLATDYKTRTGVPDKDARVKNGYVETRGDQSVVRKRPVARGGIDVGTGIAQGGLGFELNGTSYVYLLNGDVGATYDISDFSWSASTAYSIGALVFYNASNPTGDPFEYPGDPYYAIAPNTNSNPVDNPNYWSTSPAPSTRYYAFGSGTNDGVLRTTSECATALAATQMLYDMHVAAGGFSTACPGLAPNYIWWLPPLTVVGTLGYGKSYGTAGVRECGNPANGPFTVAFANIVQTV